MKKAIAPLLAAIIFLMSGCGVFQVQSDPEPSSKACRIEVLSADGTLLQTIEGSETAGAILDCSDWEAAAPPGEAVKELELAVYQEATLLGQDPAEEREFVNIMRITMFQGTNCVEARIMGGAVPGAGIPEEFLTFYYAMPKEISGALREQAFGFEV